MNTGYLTGAVVFVLALSALMVAASTVKIAKEYERGVVFRLGRLIALKGPGLFFIFPFGIEDVYKRQGPGALGTCPRSADRPRPSAPSSPWAT